MTLMPQRWMTFFAAVVLVAATAVVGTAQQESIEELRAKAEQGDAFAQHMLGLNYEYGINGVHTCRWTTEEGYTRNW